MQEHEYDQEGKSLQEYIQVLKRRKGQLIVPAVIVLFVALALAFALPANYQSTATILIEEQEIPKDFVRSTITSFAAQQVQVISQRILTVENIKGIAEKFGLYQTDDSSTKLPSTELAQMFRKEMSLDLVSADVIDPRSGRPTEATIAFTLSFNSKNPSIAQKVTNELVTLFLNENLRDRTAQAASTAEFLSAEAVQLDSELKTLEEKLAKFKTANEGSLPELYQFNLSTLERTQREISDSSFRLQELEKRRIELAAELTQLSPSAPVVLPSGQVVLSDLDRLKALQSEYRKKAAIYRDNHPDVVRLNREIKELQQALGMGNVAEELKKQLQEVKLHYANLRDRYQETHPDVINMRNIVAQVEGELAEAEQQNQRAVARQPQADNPAYVLLSTQLKTIEAEIRTLSGKRIELQNKIAKYEALLQKAPNVEKDYQALLRDYSNATAKYQEIKAKQREANVAENLEQEQKGERFTLIEPPALPLTPFSPNRRAIIMLGVILAGAAGLGFVFLKEAMDSAIHGVRELTALMGTAPLMVMPYIDNEDDVSRRRRIVLIALVMAVSLAMLTTAYIHFFFKPLDVLYFIILNKVGLSQ